MRVAAEFAVLLLADDKARFTVRLVADYSVEDVDSAFLELARPLDIVFLVEARLQLDENRHLLAVCGGGLERLHDGRAAPGAVERHFYREDVGVVRGGCHEVFDGGEAVVGVVEDSVALADYRENVRAVFETRGSVGLERRELQVGTLDHIVRRREPCEIQRAAVDFVDEVFVEVNRLNESPQRRVAHAAFDFEAHRRALAAVVELVFDGLEQVFGFLFVEIEVGVAGDSENRPAPDFVSREELLGKVFYRVAEVREVRAVRAVADFYEARENRRNRDNRDVARSAAHVGVRDLQQNIQPLVAQVREGVRGVDRKRREGGVDVVFEEFFEPRLFRYRAFLRRFEEDFFLAQGGQDFLRPDPIFVRRHSRRDFGDSPQLLARAQPVEPDFGDSRLELLLEPRDADFEEFVEVVADNREEAQPLEQRERRFGAQVEDASVERQPAQLAVEVFVVALVLGVFHSARNFFSFFPLYFVFRLGSRRCRLKVQNIDTARAAAVQKNCGARGMAGFRF